MRIELGLQKLPTNIIPVGYESQLLCALAIDQSILGRSNALITPLKYLVLGGFHLKKVCQAELRCALVRGKTDSSYEQFKISPETIQQ